MRAEYDFRMIGRNLKKLRRQKGLSIEQVREYMLIGSPQAIYKWERGEGMPQADTLLALLELYEVRDIYQLIREEGAEPSSFFCTATSQSQATGSGETGETVRRWLRQKALHLAV